MTGVYYYVWKVYNMNYIIFDLEWNQSPSGKTYSNKNLPFEIVEIGAVKLNSCFKEVGRFSELVRPRVYKNINYIIGNIIHIREEELKKARPFKEVMESFLQFCGTNYIFCTWGNLDLLELQRNMKYFGMKPLSEGPICFIDVQKVFALQTEGKKYQHTLEYAVDYCRIKKDVSFHRAFADAYYTSRILSRIKRKYRKKLSFDTYCIPQSKEEEVRITFDSYYKYISRGFYTKKDALQDEEVSYCGCYLCKRKTEETVPWFSKNNKHYYSVAFCKKHGYIKAKNRVRKSESGQIYIVKTMKKISEEEKDILLDKYQKTLTEHYQES